jgi:hypothetical protein
MEYWSNGLNLSPKLQYSNTPTFHSDSYFGVRRKKV